MHGELVVFGCMYLPHV